MHQELIKHLESFITDRRRELFLKVLAERTRYITVILEDLYQPHNTSAVLRSCECFGIQDIHIIEKKNTFEVHPDIVLGASKWLTINKYPPQEMNTKKTFSVLKALGYRIVATVPDPSAVTVDQFNLSKGKIALAFGTELTGLSREAIQSADEFLHIPMFGFTESFNISVSAGIILYALTSGIRNHHIRWKLSPEEQEGIYVQWLQNSIKSADGIIARWNEKYPGKYDKNHDLL